MSAEHNELEPDIQARQVVLAPDINELTPTRLRNLIILIYENMFTYPDITVYSTFSHTHHEYSTYKRVPASIYTAEYTRRAGLDDLPMQRWIGDFSIELARLCLPKLSPIPTLEEQMDMDDEGPDGEPLWHDPDNLPAYDCVSRVYNSGIEAAVGDHQKLCGVARREELLLPRFNHFSYFPFSF